MNGAVCANTRRIRLPTLLLGVLLISAFFGLDATSNTTRVVFIAPWDASSRGELYFWLGALLFLLPGAALVGISLADIARPLLDRVAARLAVATAHEKLALALTLGVLAWVVARLGNQLVMLGQPFTDDEDAARFGGQVLASGSLWSPLPPLRFAFPELFLFQRDGSWTSFDFPGALLPWTLAELTGSDTLVFSLFACLLPASVALACTRRHGAALGLTAGVLLLCSPMAATLSMTSHTHVVSRGLLALGLGLLLFVERPGVLRCLAAGAVFGLAFMTRPPETTMLLSPLVAYWSWQAYRLSSARPRLAALLVGALPLVVATFLYNHALTGSFGFPRSHPNEIVVPYASAMHAPFDLTRMWPRFGNNFSYNLLTLSIWFLGPVGLALALAWLGARVSREHLMLGVGVLMDLTLTMLHDDRGLHMVGPIHLSELAVPLAVLSAAGIPSAFDALEKLGVTRVQSVSGLLGHVVLGLGLFVTHHARALHEQALSRVTLTEIVETVPALPAVVLVGPYARFRDELTAHGATGGFVFEWRRARPDLSDRVLVLHDSPEARAGVERAFPDRTAYVMELTASGMTPRTVRSLRESAKAAPPP